MKTLTLLAATAAVALAASPAAAAYVYTPTSAFATVEGNTNNVVFDRNGDTHAQWFFDPSIFGTSELLISGVAFRFDSIVGGVSSGDFVFDPSFRVTLGTLAGAPGTTFSDNLGGAVTVLSGRQTIPFTLGGGVNQTKAFGVQLNFTTPFLYNPSAGKLVFDMFAPSQGAFGTFDFVSNNPLESRLFNFNGDASTGSVQAFGPVARFDVSAVPGVPEPAAWALMILGFGGVGAILRGRRRNLVRLAA